MVEPNNFTQCACKCEFKATKSVAEEKKVAFWLRAPLWKIRDAMAS